MPELRTLYVYRPLINAEEVIDWAKSVGFKTCLPAKDMHVTVIYSKTRVNWDLLMPSRTELVVSGGRRKIEKLNLGAVVIRFASNSLKQRNRELLSIGCQSDWPEFKAHVTLTYKGRGVEPEQPYRGDLIFAGEVWQELKKEGF